MNFSENPNEANEPRSCSVNVHSYKDKDSQVSQGSRRASSTLIPGTIIDNN
jgi:hypothetical protein